MSNELKQIYIDGYMAARKERDYDPMASEALCNAIEAENTRTSLKEQLTYQKAKKAVELFESEWIGQEPKQLWDWAINEVSQAQRRVGQGSTAGRTKEKRSQYEQRDVCTAY